MGTLSEEAVEDTRDGLREWLISMGNMGTPTSETEDGVPYTTISIDFTSDELGKAVDEFKNSVLKYRGANGFYIRVLPSLVFDGEKVYTLRTRIAPKGKEIN